MSVYWLIPTFLVLVAIIARVWWLVDMWPDTWPWRLKQRKPLFTCPQCGHTTDDASLALQGYCAECYDYTGELP